MAQGVEHDLRELHFEVKALVADLRAVKVRVFPDDAGFLEEMRKFRDAAAALQPQFQRLEDKTMSVAKVVKASRSARDVHGFVNPECRISPRQASIMRNYDHLKKSVVQLTEEMNALNPDWRA